MISFMLYGLFWGLSVGNEGLFCFAEIQACGGFRLDIILPVLVHEERCLI